jgi:predicted deacylase
VIREHGGYGNLDTSVKAKHDGLFVTRCPILARVKRGDRIGELFSPDGRLLQTFRANRSGRLFLTRHASPIQRGDLVFQVT